MEGLQNDCDEYIAARTRRSKDFWHGRRVGAVGSLDYFGIARLGDVFDLLKRRSAEDWQWALAALSTGNLKNQLKSSFF